MQTIVKVAMGGKLVDDTELGGASKAGLSPAGLEFESLGLEDGRLKAALPKTCTPDISDENVRVRGCLNIVLFDTTLFLDQERETSCSVLTTQKRRHKSAWRVDRSPVSWRLGGSNLACQLRSAQQKIRNYAAESCDQAFLTNVRCRAYKYLAISSVFTVVVVEEDCGFMLFHSDLCRSVDLDSLTPWFPPSYLATVCSVQTANLKTESA
ncbi:hypothetical protein BaRGS_00014687 [Batillaria attramentaria]|uniref:Uncharacterized protein n=1 Tax=Batillaria attramentaria TaxID=370345 RepID=A0ABD0L3P5_9CAEN